jgi:hypothetical protein
MGLAWHPFCFVGWTISAQSLTLRKQVHVRINPRVAFALSTIAATCALSCSSVETANTAQTFRDLGQGCVPEPEVESHFSGFSRTHVEVIEGTEQCQSHMCLVNHFQGRVSCPNGQSSVDINNASYTCTIPGASDPVMVPVQPQLTNRRDADSVYCSCRCAGSDPNATYCKCGDGFQCVDLVPDYGVGASAVAGSYCVKNGTIDDGSQGTECTNCSTTQLPPLAAGSGGTTEYYSTLASLPVTTDVSSGQKSIGCTSFRISDWFGAIPCVVVTAFAASSTCATGETRLAASSRVVKDVLGKMQADGLCDASSGTACQDLTLCSVPLAAGYDELASCAQDTTVTSPDYCSCINDPQSSVAGYCEVDRNGYVPSLTNPGIGNPEFVSQCPATSEHIVRIPKLGNPMAVYAACQYAI